jgi:NAD-dependent deacetylase
VRVLNRGSKLKPDISALLGKIAAARYITALTGAGISTLSGLPDFRGKNGLYTKPLQYPGGPAGPELIFDIAQFEKDPAFFYRAAGSFIYTMDEREPSLVHIVLAEMESRGLLRAVITQNIDMLHQKAGSRRVIELHGSPRTHHCLRCGGVRVSFAEAAARVKAGALPRCPRCDGVLKPAITFFGEPLPLEARRAAEEETQRTDLLLVLGTALRVSPAADLPRNVLRRGGEMVIINDTPTPLDTAAALGFKSLGPVFTALRSRLHRLKASRDSPWF